jgi:hypothetical protein
VALEDIAVDIAEGIAGDIVEGIAGDIADTGVVVGTGVPER